jgi:hypothetical protein
LVKKKRRSSRARRARVCGEAGSVRRLSLTYVVVLVNVGRGSTRTERGGGTRKEGEGRRRA